MNAAVILGAGFSKNSGIPVECEIPRLLIPDKADNEFDDAVGVVLKRFMEDIFGYDGTGTIPALSDILNSIDISTSSGHCLGIKYNPIHLRAIKRMLMYRLFNVLEDFFKPSNDVKKLIEILQKSFSNIGYIVLNWDTVLEKYLLSNYGNLIIDYCNGGSLLEAEHFKIDRTVLQIAKIHGSCNWLYCNNCRTVFNDLFNSTTVTQRAGFQKNDLNMFDEFNKVRDIERYINIKKCSLCNNDISSHIATFGYRKSFKANSFPNIWNRAEHILTDADKWIFIGYSLPEADYEFKHLLKIAELKLQHVKNNVLSIDIILLNDNNSVNKYRNYFGKRINIICNKGISEYINYFKC